MVRTMQNGSCAVAGLGEEFRPLLPRCLSSAAVLLISLLAESCRCLQGGVTSPFGAAGVCLV